jgi:hypothetical protein
VVLNDREAPLRFLRTAYEPTDWVAVFLKTYQTGATAQRVVSLSEATSPRFQSWLPKLHGGEFDKAPNQQGSRYEQDRRQCQLEDDEEGSQPSTTRPSPARVR